MTTQPEVTRLLHQWSEGDPEALGKLMPVVLEELRTIAGRYFRREGEGHTLQPTALVNEVYLKLVDRRTVQWQNRAHFFGFAAQLMRRILVDHARSKKAAKRGGEAVQIPLEGALSVTEQPVEDLMALDDALQALEKIDPRQSQIIELRFFAGLENREIAEVLGISNTTVKREWATARAWLFRELARN